MTGSEALLSAFDVEEMSIEALLFQTGYLTITDEEDRLAKSGTRVGCRRDGMQVTHSGAGGRIRYRLGYPNHEVRQSLNERLLMALLPEAAQRQADDAPLWALLAANDFAGLEAFLRSLFAGIPYQWHVNNNIQHYEGYYASVVYSCFASHGFDLVPEESSSAGRADMVVRLDRRRVRVRVQIRGRGRVGTRASADQGERLRGEVPPSRPAHPPDRRGVQQGGAEHRGLRGGSVRLDGRVTRNGHELSELALHLSSVASTQPHG